MKTNSTTILISSLLSFTLLIGYTNTSTKKTSQLAVSKAPPKVEKEASVVQIALLLDTSNSMDGLINQAKSQLWDIVNEFGRAKCPENKNPKLQIAIYQYGNDDLSSTNGYVKQVLNFTDDLDDISEKLFSLTTNGGEEYCGEVIQTSLEQLEWKKAKNQLKLIFIAGNEPFNQGSFSYESAIENANKKDVIVNTIFCGNYEQGIHDYWKNAALKTGGEYMAIDHTKAQVYIKTPYDDAILKLNTDLNKTYVSYGVFGKAKMESQKTQDTNAIVYEETVAVKRAISKSSSLYNNKKWDLVDAIKDDASKIQTISVDELPLELQNKSEKELKIYLSKMKQKRETIQNEIQDLNRKRQTYITKHEVKADKEALESVMLTALKKQAAAKNYTW